MIIGRVHSFESFGAADGPGVRFVVFMHGCVCRCAYCHNPDTWATPPRHEVTADDVVRKALRYREYWGEKGGITLSGGEPMMQAAFGAELFGKIHALGATTCLDTSAAVFSRADRAMLSLLESSDTVLLDIKAFDPKLHKRLTGVDNAPVLDCARYLAERGIKAWIRRVIVPGLTDQPEDLEATREFISTLGNVEKVEVLPYHDFGVPKWNALGLDYTLANVCVPSAEAIAAAREVLGVKN